MKKADLFARLSRLALLIALLPLLAGCAGYRVGSMLPDDVKSVFVPTFENRTGEPLIEIDTTQAVIQELQRDGSLSVAPEDQADAVLRVVLTEYRIEPIAFRDDVRTAAEQYRLWITANVVMRRTADQSVVVESPIVRGKYVFDVVGDLSSSKLTANPRAAEDLAKSIVQMMVEYWP